MNDPRLSYLQPLEEEPSNHMDGINPCRSLTEVFNSVLEEEAESQHLKVYLRIRPLLSEETISSQDGNVEILNKRCMLLTAPKNSNAFKNKPQGSTKVSHKFTFSHIYNQETAQKTIFEDTTQCLVKDLVNCQNCLLFTYGATNSGKTYTIQGSNSNPGLLPRTLNLLFSTIGNQQYKGNDIKPHYFRGVIRLQEHELKKEEEIKETILKGFLDNASSLSGSILSASSRVSKPVDAESSCGSITDESIVTDVSSVSYKESFEEGLIDSTGAIYAIFVSFAEIYNEYIYDLLDSQAMSKKKNPLALGEDRHGAIYIKGLNEIRISNTEEAMRVLEVGKQNLHFAATRLNHNSSRSHCIFTVKLIRFENHDPHLARVSMLSLCDLAGAERAGKTLNSVDRLKEANNINTSLLVLGRCMTALRQNQIIAKQTCGSKKSIPIPYRESKVTRIFQSFFMGKGKVSMIVNISTSSFLFDETLTVLKFSALASKVTITQEKFSFDQPLQDKNKSSNFSRFMRHSLNMSTSSGRLSVPWSNKSLADVTFGANEAENSRMIAVPEEEDDDAEEEDNERYEALLSFIETLKQKLLQESKDKAALEVKLRKEICEAFSKKIVQIEETWKSRLEDEQIRADEYMEWRMKHVLNSVQKSQGSRKRLRPSDEADSGEETVPAIDLVREELKVQNLEDENSQLRDEMSALKQSMKATNQALKTFQEENSKLVFQLADITNTLESLTKEKEKLQGSLNVARGSLSNVTSTDALIVEELQYKIEQLQASFSDKDTELQTTKDLLVEAAEEFRLKEDLISSLKKNIEELTKQNTSQAMANTDLESQLSEMKNLLDNQRTYLEEREQTLHELQSQIQSPLNDKRQLVDTKVEEIEELNQNLLSEIADLKISMADNSSLLEELKTQLTSKDDLNKKLSLQLNEETKIREVVEIQAKESQEAVEKLTSDLQKLQEHLDESERENIQEVENENKLLYSKLAEMEHKIQKLTQEVELNEETKISLTNEIKSNQNRMEELVKENTKLEDIQNANEELKSSLKDANECNDSMAKQLAELEEKVRKDTTCEEISRLSACLDEKDEVINQLNFDIKEGTILSSESLARINELEEVLVLKEFAIKDLWKEINELRGLSDENQAKISKSDEELKALADKNESLDEKLKQFEDISEQKLIIEKELKMMKNTLQESENNNLNLMEKLTVKDDVKAELQETANELSLSKAENAKLKEMLGVISKKESDLEELNFKSQSEILNLSTKLDDKSETFKKMAGKIEYLDKKVNETEDELETFRSKCAILEKEVAALREARVEETNNQLHQLNLKDTAIAAKEAEISALEQEVKRLIQRSPDDKTKEANKMKELHLETVQNKLASLEEEHSKTKQQLSDAQQEFEEFKNLQVSQSLPPKSTRARGRQKSSFQPTSETSEIDSTINETPATKGKSTRGRKKRTTNPLSVIENSATTPDHLRLALDDTSEGDDEFTPAPRTRTTRFGRTVKPPKSLNESFDSDFKKPKSSRKYNVKPDEESDFESEASWELKSSKSSSRSVSQRKNKRTVSKIFNPHLAEKENKTIELSSTLENSKEEDSKSKIGSRTRKRRDLYSTGINKPYECVPNLIELKEPDSPHTTVRHMLRSKTSKRK